jgi:hypothetical protein
VTKKERRERLESLEAAIAPAHLSGIIIYPNDLARDGIDAWLENNPQYQACKAAGRSVIVLPEKRPLL